MRPVGATYADDSSTGELTDRGFDLVVLDVGGRARLLRALDQFGADLPRTTVA